MQPSLFEICQTYLEMEKENKRLTADLAKTHSKFNLPLVHLLMSSSDSYAVCHVIEKLLLKLSRTR
jgi:hypothetical protein